MNIGDGNSLQKLSINIIIMKLNFKEYKSKVYACWTGKDVNSSDKAIAPAGVDVVVA